MKRIDLKHCIVTAPNNGATQAVVLYGGLMGWEGDWFLKHGRIPAMLLESVYFVLPTHFTNSCATCLAEFRNSVAADSVGRFSLCGFSRGAQEVYRNKKLERWKIFGLVDPSAPTLDIFEDDVVDDIADQVRCVYWVPNWGKDGYKGRVPRFAQHLRDLSVNLIEKEVAHADMPKFFFDNFGRELTA